VKREKDNLFCFKRLSFRIVRGGGMGLLISCLILITLGVGCDRKEDSKEPGTTFEIEKEYRRGPVIFVLKVSRKEITIAERFHLALEVRSKEEYEVKLPEFGKHLERFGIVDYRAPSPQLVDDGMVRSRRFYELEPFLSGDYKIPPMKILFWKKGEEGGKRHEMESEELIITVKSLLPENAAALMIKEIVPPVQLPEPAQWWLYGAIGVAILAASGGFVCFLWRRGRANGEAAFRQAAHEIAYEGLEALLAEKLIEKGDVKTFYLRLSGVLRYYIENRFGLRAPERTTEEFLRDLRSTDVLGPSHKDLLRAFLQHCDMVKFAAHQPTHDEIQKAFDSCKQFIIETEITKDPGSAAAASAG
jgi:hypothetical protein